MLFCFMESINQKFVCFVEEVDNDKTYCSQEQHRETGLVYDLLHHYGKDLVPENISHRKAYADRYNTKTRED